MALFIHSLLIVLIMKSHVELQVGGSRNQRTVSCDVDTSSKVDELRLIVENYLVILDDEVRNTQDLVKELQFAVSTNQETATAEQEKTRQLVSGLQVAASTNQERGTSEHEDTRRMVSELQVAVATNQERATSEQEETRRRVGELQVAVSTNQETAIAEQEETRRRVGELQVAVSTNQETVIAEQEETRRMVSELQVTVSTSQEKVSAELRNTTLQLKETRRQLGVMERQMVELLESVSALKAVTTIDCSDILARGEACSGVYVVKPDCGRTFNVYCDMETDGGGWTVFQRRQDGSVDFYLDFANYSLGFGNLEGEFWLGNDYLHRLTAQGEYELRVDLSSLDGRTGYAVYDSFRIANVSDHYRLTLGSYSGTAGDSLAFQRNRPFSTKDRNTNDWSGFNCAERYHGAWWYYGCYHSNLNGRYFTWTVYDRRGIIWNDFPAPDDRSSLKTTEMKIRRICVRT
ncbi:uncharacterized protein [Asterias amurensis]|uniref:uncharacterized protein n=1 Tax=Asterias amurensis TaxID=7602 RepID=UPI003AB46C09